MEEILVLVDTSAASQQRVELAIKYFRFFGSHITGLILKPDVHIVEYMNEEAFLDLSQQYDNEFNVRLAEAEMQFQQTTAGIKEYTDCVIETGDVDDILMGYARRSDFIIVGQYNPAYWEDPTLGEPDNLILHSGRPVIVVPYVECSTAFPQHIMVAWDGSREAARALYDAMPLLKVAQTVELCTVEEAKKTSSTYAGVDAMLVQLQRHGVTAQARRLSPGNLSIGNTLLNHIVDSGAEMLVAGAYGHNRIKEMVLGGVTRELLAHCSIPLLMSK